MGQLRFRHTGGPKDDELFHEEGRKELAALHRRFELMN